MRGYLTHLTGFMAALLAAQGMLTAQAPRAEAVSPRGGSYPPAYPAERMEAVDPDKKLSPGDQVTLEIVEDRDGALPRVITATGDLDVPPLGRVHVVGKTTREATADIKHRLEVDYYYKATVNLSIDRVSPTMVRSGIVYLAGEVRVVGPVELIANESLKLSEAILKSGGFGAWADDRKVQVTRKTAGGVKTFVVDVKDVIHKGRVEKDLVLQDGDRVYVPQAFFKK